MWRFSVGHSSDEIMNNKYMLFNNVLHFGRTQTQCSQTTGHDNRWLMMHGTEMDTLS
jgi:hypothetical protein